jgi:hypothetical protein
MIFLFPVPLWFVGLWIFGGLVFAIYEMIEDAEIRADERWRRTHLHAPGVLDEMAKRIEHHLNAYKIAEAERLLKRLAEHRK